MVEEAFRLNVKWSLQELSRAINGDGKNTPNPLFRIKVVLEANQVEFSPSVNKLASIINTAAKDLTDHLAVFQRLSDILTNYRSRKQVSVLVYFEIFCSLILI